MEVYHKIQLRPIWWALWIIIINILYLLILLTCWRWEQNCSLTPIEPSLKILGSSIHRVDYHNCFFIRPICRYLMLRLHYVPGLLRQSRFRPLWTSWGNVGVRDGKIWKDRESTLPIPSSHVPSLQSRFDHGRLNRGCRGRREHNVNAALAILETIKQI